MEWIKKTLKKIDIAGVPPTHTVEGQGTSFKSVKGGLLSIVIICLSLTYTTYIMYLWYDGQILPRTQINQLQVQYLEFQIDEKTISFNFKTPTTNPINPFRQDQIILIPIVNISNNADFSMTDDIIINEILPSEQSMSLTQQSKSQKKSQSKARSEIKSLINYKIENNSSNTSKTQNNNISQSTTNQTQIINSTQTPGINSSQPESVNTSQTQSINSTQSGNMSPNSSIIINSSQSTTNINSSQSMIINSTQSMTINSSQSVNGSIIQSQITNSNRSSIENLTKSISKNSSQSEAMNSNRSKIKNSSESEITNSSSSNTSHSKTKNSSTKSKNSGNSQKDSITIVYNQNDFNKKSKLKNNSQILVTFVKCSLELLKENQQCANQSVQDNYFNSPGKKIYMRVRTESFNGNTFEFEAKSKNYQFLIDEKQSLYTQVVLQTKKMSVYHGILFQSKIEKNFLDSIQTHTQTISFEQSLKLFNQISFATFIISLDSILEYEQISYPTFGEVGAQIGSIVNIIMLIKLLIVYYNTGEYQSKLIDVIISSSQVTNNVDQQKEENLKPSQDKDKTKPTAEEQQSALTKTNIFNVHTELSKLRILLDHLNTQNDLKHLNDISIRSSISKQSLINNVQVRSLRDSISVDQSEKDDTESLLIFEIDILKNGENLLKKPDKNEEIEKSSRSVSSQNIGLEGDISAMQVIEVEPKPGNFKKKNQVVDFLKGIDHQKLDR